MILQEVTVRVATDPGQSNPRSVSFPSDIDSMAWGSYPLSNPHKSHSALFSTRIGKVAFPGGEGRAFAADCVMLVGMPIARPTQGDHDYVFLSLFRETRDRIAGLSFTEDTGRPRCEVWNSVMYPA